MQIIRYNLVHRVNIGTMEEPSWEEQIGSEVIMPCTDANLSIARKEAWQGIVETVEDGQPEPDERTLEQRLADTEEALELLLSGVTE